MQDNLLTDKVALITGGARRIGRAIAQRLHQEGMRIVVHYHSSADDADTLVAELNGRRPDSAVSVQGDLTQSSTVETLVIDAVDSCGRLDVVVNNASIFYPTPIGSTGIRHWDELMDVNLKAPYLVAKSAAPALKATRGCIINIADIYGFRPLKSHTVYCTAKAGLIMLTRALARDLAPEVRVNAIAPGAILWPAGDIEDQEKQRIISRTPLQRQGTPQEIAAVVLFLIRDATYTSGHIIPVDGGRSIVP